MILEPVGIAHLHEAVRGMPHEQEFLIAEAVLEVGEEGRLAAGNAVGVVHEAARLGLADQRDPRIAQVLLPRVGEVEGMAHLVHRRPEPHALDPGDRVGIRGRRDADEGIVEHRRALAVIRSDIVEHDSAKAEAPVVLGGKEHPHRPLGVIGEARPIGLHGVMHLGVAPGPVGVGVDHGNELVSAGLRDAEPGAFEDLLDGQVLARQSRRTIGMVAGLHRGRGEGAFNGVVLELDRVEPFGLEAVLSDPHRRAAAREGHFDPLDIEEGRRDRLHLDMGVGELGRVAAFLVPDVALPAISPGGHDAGDPMDMIGQAVLRPAAHRHLRVVAVDVETDLLAPAPPGRPLGPGVDAADIAGRQKEARLQGLGFDGDRFGFCGRLPFLDWRIRGIGGVTHFYLSS